jgi:hypothetical protein
MELEEVLPTEEQIKILYQQLKKRKYNISHNTLPTYKKHREFVKDHPYRAWFIIQKFKKLIGNIYIHFDNSIGLNCEKDVTESQINEILTIVINKFVPLDATSSVRYGGFFLNVSSKNFALQKKLKKLGFIEKQRSYILDKNIQ